MSRLGGQVDNSDALDGALAGWVPGAPAPHWRQATGYRLSAQGLTLGDTLYFAMTCATEANGGEGDALPGSEELLAGPDRVDGTADSP
jgi:hypothetical protein